MRELSGGLREQGLYAVRGDSLEDALRANDRLSTEIVRTATRNDWNPAEVITSLASLLPAAQTQNERAAAWRLFWDKEEGRALARLDAIAATTGFSPRAFLPFKEWVGAEPEPMTPEKLSSLGLEAPLLLARPDGDSWLVYSLVRADDPPPGLVSTLEKNGGVYVSGRSFRAAMDEATRTDMLRCSGLALLAIFCASALALRSLPRLGVALLPVACGLVCVLGTFFLTGMELNIFHAMALPLVMALTIDYGIFILAHLEGRLGKESRTGVLLSGITTLSGFGVLLLARHPALHSIGQTVTLGLGAALAAALALPLLFDGRKRAENHA
jgi:predicted exporter